MKIIPCLAGLLLHCACFFVLLQKYNLDSYVGKKDGEETTYNGRIFLVGGYGCEKRKGHTFNGNTLDLASPNKNRER